MCKLKEAWYPLPPWTLHVWCVHLNLAEFRRRSPRLAGSLLEVQEQAGRGSGQAG